MSEGELSLILIVVIISFINKKMELFFFRNKFLSILRGEGIIRRVRFYSETRIGSY